MDLFALEARLKLNTDDYTLGLEEAEAQAREMVEASENAAEGANALSEAMSSQAGEIGEAEGAAQELADVYHEIGDAADDAASEAVNMSGTVAEVAGDMGDAVGEASNFADELGDVEDAIDSVNDSAADASGILASIFGGVSTDGMSEALSFIEGLAGSAWGVVEGYAANGDEIAKTSKKLGMSAETYQELSHIAQHAGTDVSVFSRGMMQISDAMEEVRAASETPIDTKAIEKAKIAYDAAEISTRKAEQAYKDAVREHGQYSMEAEEAAIRLRDAQSTQDDAWQTLNNTANGTTQELGKTAQAIQDLGVQMTDSSGNLRSEEDVLWDIIFALQDMDDTTRRNAIASDIFQRSYRELLPLLNQSSEETKAQIDSFHDLGGVLSDESLKASEDFQDAHQDMMVALDGVKNRIVGKFIPEVTNAENTIRDAALGGQYFLDEFDKDAGKALNSLWDSFVSVYGGIAKDAWDWGKDMVGNFIDGVKGMWGHAQSALSDFAGMIKSYLGFSEPEEGPLSNFHTYAPDMMALFAEGIRANEKLITDAVDDVFDIDFTPESARASVAAAPSETYSVERMRANDRPVNVIFELDGVQRWVYRLTKAEEQRVGVKLAGVM